MGIGPTQPAWKAGVLPLNYTRTSFTMLNDYIKIHFCCQSFLSVLLSLLYLYLAKHITLPLLYVFVFVVVFAVLINFFKKHIDFRKILIYNGKKATAR